MWPLESKLDGSTLIIPLPCLSGTCVLHNGLKQLRGCREGNKTTQKPEKELAGQVNLSWLLHSNNVVALQCKDVAASRTRVLLPGITDQMPQRGWDQVPRCQRIREHRGMGGVTAGCREVTDTWAMGDTGGLARGWEEEVGGGDPLPQGHGTPGPKAQWRAQQPLTGRTEDALEAGSTSQPTLVPTPVPPRAPTIPTPHHGLTCGFLGSKLAKLQRLDKVEGLQGAGQIRGHNKAPVPTVIGIKGHSHSTFFSSIAK